MSLPQLAGTPRLRVTIRGREYLFSEITIGGWAGLQAWIEDRADRPYPDIVDRIGDVWEGLRDRVWDDEDRRIREWPPQIGTPGGSKVLDTHDGRVETIYQGLLVHQPQTTRAEAMAFYRGLKGLRDADLMARVFGAIFGAEARPKSARKRRYWRFKGGSRGKGEPEAVRWDVYFGAAAQRLHWGRDEVCRHTLSQLLNALDTTAPEERGDGSQTVELRSLDDIERLYEMVEE